MLFLAWFSLIVYTASTVLGSYQRVQRGENFLQFIITLATQLGIIWCLIFLIMLL